MQGYVAIGWGLVAAVAAVGVWTARGSIRSAQGPRERTFVIRTCAATWLLVAGFVAAVFLLPRPYNWIVAAALMIGIPAAMYRWTTQRQLIRELDARDRRDEAREA